MASCGFAQLVGGACGSSAHNPANVQCVSVGNLHNKYPRPSGSLPGIWAL